jgi:hypothetical protein
MGRTPSNPERPVIRSALVLGLTLAALAPASAFAGSPYGVSTNATQRSSKASGGKQVFTETLRQAGHVVGHDKFICTRKTPKTFTCTGVVTWAPSFLDGTLTLAGTMHRGWVKSTLKITGGTGDSANATGTYTVKFDEHGRAYVDFDYPNG